MRKNIKAYTLSVLTFLCILSLEASFAAPFALIIHALAFIVPSAFCLCLCKSDVKSTALFKATKSAFITLPIALPSLLLIFGLSYLVSLIIFTLTGKESPDPTTGDLLYDIFSLAVLPAVLEELLFRFVPLKTIAPYSKKTALIISSLFFAMGHASFFSIPYALLAGIIFMVLDLLCDSVLPSVILHLLNNIISLVWTYGKNNSDFKTVFLSVFIIGALVSIAFVPFMIKRYKETLKSTFIKEDKTALPLVTLFFIIPTFILALFEFI